MFRAGFSLRAVPLLTALAIAAVATPAVALPRTATPPTAAAIPAQKSPASPAVPVPTPPVGPAVPVPTPATPAPTTPASPLPAPVSDPLPANPVFDAQLTAVMRGNGGAVALVGRSGQLYEPAGDLQWTSRGAGGVSTSVQGMYRSPAGKLYAVGDRAPLFARQDGLWAAYPLARAGSSAASSGTEPVIALQRQIYELGANGWRSIATAPAAVEHLWASSPSRIYVSDREDQLWAGRGAGWQRIQITLMAGEHIAGIHGLAGKLAVALTTSGRLFALDNRAAKVLNVATLGPNLDIQALGVADGRLLAAAQQGEANVLLEIGAKKIAVIAKLWPLVSGDRFAVIAPTSVGLLVATSRGQARVRLPNQVWRNAKVSAHPPNRPPGLSKSGPAHAR